MEGTGVLRDSNKGNCNVRLTSGRWCSVLSASFLQRHRKTLEKDDQSCEMSESHIINETIEKNVGEELGLRNP